MFCSTSSSTCSRCSCAGSGGGMGAGSATGTATPCCRPSRRDPRSQSRRRGERSRSRCTPPADASHAHTSMVFVSAGYKRLVSMVSSAQLPPMTRSTISARFT
ncbi:hypothetical protein SEVIR_9G251155v4 [Setaria viridis]